MSLLSVDLKQLPHGADLPLPEYATAQSAAVDLQAAIDGTLVLAPGKRAMVETGIAIALPAGFEAQVRPRSGLAAKNGVTVLNSPGILINHGDEAFEIERGMRIAQLVVAPVTQVSWNAVEDLDETARGAGGFGSTGTASPAR